MERDGAEASSPASPCVVDAGVVVVDFAALSSSPAYANGTTIQKYLTEPVHLIKHSLGQAIHGPCL